MWHISAMVTRYKAKRLRRHFIREWLEAKNVKQVELARRMNTDKANVTRWIDEPRRINMDVLSGVADALGLTDAGDLLRSPDEATALNDAKHAARQLLGLAPDLPKNRG
jgi:transcriptional regulator with XRE-family HTH domain